MAGSIWDEIDPAVTSGTQLATLLNSLKDAYTTNVKGTSRPANLAPGGCWLDSTSEAAPDYLWTLKMYDGTDDISMLTVNISTNSVYVNGATDTFTITHTSADAVGPKLILRKKRIATNGKVLSGDVVGLLEMRSTDQLGTEITLAGSIEAVATEDHTSTAHGTKLDFYVKKIGTTSRALIATVAELGLKSYQYISGYSTTATAAGTTTLTAASNHTQYFTGITTQTIVLPVCSTLELNVAYRIVNNSTGNLTVNSSGGSLVQTLLPNTSALITCVLASGTSAASWQSTYVSNQAAATATALTAMLRDANANALINNILNGYTTIATAAGTTVLTVASTNTQLFTGITTQIVTLPVTSTLALNHPFYIINNSTGIITVKASGGNTVKAIPAGGTALFICVLTSGVTEASWFVDYSMGNTTSDVLTLKDYDGGTATDTSRFTLGKASTTTLNALTRKQATLHYDTTRNKPVYDTGTVLKVIGSGSGGTKNYIEGGDAESGTTGFATYALTESVTFTDAGDTVTLASHGLSTGNLLSFSVITSTTGISINTAYYAIVSSSSVFQVASSLANAMAGTALALTTNGTGTMLKSFPKTGTGGSASSTFTTSSSSPLGDTNSFLWTKSANNRMGEGWSFDFTLDAQDKAKVMQISAKYLLSSGTFAAQTGAPGAYVPSDMVFWVYDVTNSTMIQPSSISFLSNSTGIADTFNATFQTSATGTSYRLICHTYSVSASAYTLQLDTISVSPSTYVYGTPISDWQSYTMAITDSLGANVKSAAPAVNTARWRRVGANIEVEFGYYHTATLGTSGTGQYQFHLPTGLLTDSGIVSGAGNSSSAFGTIDCDIGGAGRIRFAASGSAGLNYVVASVGIPDSTTAYSTYIGATSGGSGTSYHTGQANVAYAGRFSIAVQGWSSSVQTSDTTDTRIVAAYGVNQTPTGTLNAGWNVTKFVTVKDTHSGYSASTGLYTVTIPGFYEVMGQMEVGAASVAIGNTVAAGVGVNGSIMHTNYFRVQNTSNLGNQCGVTGTVYVNAGDTIGVYCWTNVTTPAYASSFSGSSFSIKRISGPSAIAATESINTRATNAVATTIATSGDTLIPHLLTSGVTYDTHGGWSASIYTVQTAGKYRINAKIRLTDSQAFTVQDYIGLYAKIDNSTYYVLGSFFAPVTQTQNTGPCIGGAVTLYLTAGQTIRIVTNGTMAATKTTIVSQTNYNSCEIERIGN